MICSLTKAAAHEIAGRGIPIAHDMVGTLHAHCYRTLGHPDLAEANLKQWNEEHPIYAMAGGKQNVDDVGEYTGDDRLAIINNQRAMLKPEESWPASVKLFWSKWKDWKESNGYLDFTDLIETCINDVEKAHSDPQILLGDEAQDWSKLEFKLFVDKWGKHADTIVLCGDFDQSVFTFRGADPYYFINNPVPDENKKVRAQSFRVPRSVHTTARRWIRRIRDREDVEYSPTARDGKVSQAQISLRDYKKLVTEIKARLHDGKTCMVLASCSFMLKKIISAFKDAGIPFGNQYRKQNALWNPLGRRKNATMPVDRVAAFLAPKIFEKDEWRKESMRKWTPEEFKVWASALDSKTLSRGTKSTLSNVTFKIPESFGHYNTLFTEEDHAHKSLFMDLEWYANVLPDKYAKSIGYACKVASEHDLKGITEVPPVTIGTIHSVKGGEADCVFLFPDLSREAMAGYAAGGEDMNSVIRVFYVGMTRAKEELILCQPQSKYGVRF